MRRLLLIVGVGLGCVLAMGPVWGTLGTALGMVRSFNEMSTGAGNSPDALADTIGMSLRATVAGFVVAPVGIILIVACVLALQRLPERPGTPAREREDMVYEA